MLLSAHLNQNTSCSDINRSHVLMPDPHVVTLHSSLHSRSGICCYTFQILHLARGTSPKEQQLVSLSWRVSGSMASSSPVCLSLF